MQEILNEVREAAGFLVDDLERAAPLCLAADAAQQQRLAEHADLRQGRAQLVGDAGDEIGAQAGQVVLAAQLHQRGDDEPGGEQQHPQHVRQPRAGQAPDHELVGDGGAQRDLDVQAGPHRIDAVARGEHRLVADRRMIQLAAGSVRHFERAERVVDDATGQWTGQQGELLRAHRIERGHRPGIDVESQQHRRGAGARRLGDRVHDEPRRPVYRVHQRRDVLLLLKDRVEMDRERILEPPAHRRAWRRTRGDQLARPEAQSKGVAGVARERGGDAVETGRQRGRRRQPIRARGRAAAPERLDDGPVRHVVEVLRGTLAEARRRQPRVVAQHPLGGGPMMQERPMSLQCEQARHQQAGEQHHRDENAARAAGDVPHLGQVHRASREMHAIRLSFKTV